MFMRKPWFHLLGGSLFGRNLFYDQGFLFFNVFYVRIWVLCYITSKKEVQAQVSLPVQH